MAFQSGVTGFVRIPDAIDPNKVYAIGPGGRPIANENDLMKATGASSIAQAWQLANVQIISPERAAQLAITAPEAKSRVAYPPSPAPTSSPSDNPPANNASPVSGVGSWSLSAWRSSGDKWTQQPILTIDGQQFSFNTPQEYINKIQSIKGSAPRPDLADKFIGEFQSIVPNFDNDSFANTFVNNEDASIRMSVSGMGMDNYINDLMKSQPGWSQTRKDSVANLIRSKYGSTSSSPKYVRQSGTNDVYDTQTKNVVKYEDAVKNNIWNQVKDVPSLDSYGITPKVVANNVNQSLKDNRKLIRYSSDPTPNDTGTDANTVWLYDNVEKTYRPIESPSALRHLLGLGDTPQDNEKAFSMVNVLPTSSLNEGAWQGKFIQQTDSIKEDGKIPTTSNFIEGTGTTPSDNSLKSIYGATKVPELEESIIQGIGMIFTTLKKKGQISEDTFKKYITDPAYLAKYANAWLYGGYEFGDIYRDVKAKELAAAGNSQYANFKGIDENIKASDWYNTAEGKKARGDANLTPPASELGIDPAIFNNSLFKIPGQAFQTIIPPIDWNSPEFKAEAEKIQASYYDILMQKSEATTEQAKAIAESNWKMFKENLNKKYGLELSNNAQTAWGQLQGLFGGYSSKGLANSGFFNEAMDKYLGDVRKSNDLLRQSKVSEEDATLREKLIKTGSAEDIKKFIGTSPDNRKKAEEWGLIPSSEQASWWSKDNLKKLYPDMTDAQLDAMKNTLMDENGNYRSDLYQKLWSNKYDIGEQKKTYQESKLYQQKLDEEKKAYAPFTSSNPFSSYYGTIFDKTAELPQSSSPIKISGSDAPVNPFAYQENLNPASSSGNAGNAASGSTQPIVTKSALDKIKDVFGGEWKPSPAFSGKDYLGAVRVTGTPEVYGIGKGDPYHFSADEYSKVFGSPNQSGIVGEVSRVQAKALGIPGY